MSFKFDTEAAQRLPACIKFGTSSWTYRGWEGFVYFNQYKNDKDFNRQCLGEYTKVPWFRSVGIDSSFYGPPTPQVLHTYASMVPEGFRWVSKVWERLTIPRFPSLPRYGKDAGKINSDFLNAELFVKEGLAPLAAREIAPHVGPLVFQFPTISSDVLPRAEFFTRLNEFLAVLPREYRYAIEIRNSDFLVPAYFEMLNRHAATHCFNHWHRMPRLIDQMKAAANAGGLTAPFYVARILTPLGVSYEQAVKLFQPYQEIRRENPEMRADVVRLAHRGIERAVDTYIIVNNRAEGCAPKSIDAIGRLIVSEL